MPSSHSHVSADHLTRTTKLGLSTGDRAIIIVASPLIGLVLGWLLPRIADWAAGQPWVPLHGPFRQIASWDGAWVPLVLLGVGLLAGILFIFVAFDSIVQIEIDDEQVTFLQGDRRDTVPRTSVRAAFYDHKQIVLVDDIGREHYRGQPEAKAADVAQALQMHGFRWLDYDPYADAYRRWVPNSGELPTGADALFTARSKALEDDDTGDARSLREELAKLNVVARDYQGKQYWRLVTPDAEAAAGR